MRTWRTPWGETLRVDLNVVRRLAARFLRVAGQREAAREFELPSGRPHDKEITLPYWARVLAFALGLVFEPNDVEDALRAFAHARATKTVPERIQALEAARRAYWPTYRRARAAERQAENAARAGTAKAKAFREQKLAEARRLAAEAEEGFQKALGLETRSYGLEAPGAVLRAWEALKRRAWARVLRPVPWTQSLLAWPQAGSRPWRLLAEGLEVLAHEAAEVLRDEFDARRLRVHHDDPLRHLAEDLLRRYRRGDEDAVAFMAAAGSALGLPGDPAELAQVALVGAWQALELWKEGGIPRPVWAMAHGRRAAQIFLSRGKGLKKRDAEILRRAMRMGAEEGRALLEAHGLLVEIGSLVTDEGDTLDLPDEDRLPPGEVAWRAEVRQRLIEAVGGEGKLELLLQVFVDRRPLGEIAAELGVPEESVRRGVEHLVERIKHSPELKALWLEA